MSTDRLSGSGFNKATEPLVSLAVEDGACLVDMLAEASIKNTGTIAAHGSLTTNIAGNINNKGLIEAGNLSLYMSGDLDNVGHRILSSSSIDISAKTVKNKAGTISAQGGSISVNASKLDQAANLTILRMDEDAIKAGEHKPVKYSTGKWGPEEYRGINKTGEVYLFKQTKIDNSVYEETAYVSNPATLSATGSIHLHVGSFSSVGSNIASTNVSSIEANDDVMLNSYSVHTEYQKTYNRWIKGSHTRTEGNRCESISGPHYTITSEHYKKIGPNIASRDTPTINIASEQLDLLQHSLEGGGKTANSVGALSSGRDVSIMEDTKIINDSNLVGSDIRLTSTQGGIENSGTIYASRSIIIQSAGDIKNSGTIYAGVSIIIQLTGNVENTDGVIFSGGHIGITAGLDIPHTSNSIFAMGDLTIDGNHEPTPDCVVIGDSI